MAYKRLWITLCLVVVGSFAVLGGLGTKLLSNAPPIPERVVTTEGRVLFDKEMIQNGQNVWQSIGGQETGSIWGHGSYVAPDWTADYLHRELNYTLDQWAAGYGKSGFAELATDQQTVLKARLESTFRTNTYDAATGTLFVDPVRGRAFDYLSTYYADVFASGRSEYAIPPGALYYMQGLNTTPVHGHTALFGVYGMLGIGLMLFVLRALKPGRAWKAWPLKWAFWSINLGLTLMVVMSLLPIGLMQTWASVEHGTWYARSAEFLQTGLMQNLRWLRGPGDALFAVGTLFLAYFIFNLFTGRSFEKPTEVESRDRQPRPYVGRIEAYSGD
jgi:nitric oxide reductase large subunit